jgi:hypothetical protein
MSGRPRHGATFIQDLDPASYETDTQDQDQEGRIVSSRLLTKDDPLEDFEIRQLTYDGVTKTIYAAVLAQP